MAKEVTFEIVRDLATLSVTARGRKAVTLTSWNGAKPTIDIRKWIDGENGEQERPGKGLTLSEDEARILTEVLEDYLAEDGDKT